MRMISKIILSALVAFFLLLNGTVATAGASVLPQQGSFYSVQDRQAQTISEGVMLIDYVLKIQGQSVKMSVMQIDLSNPYVKIEGLIGSDDETLGGTQQVSKMAERTGAVAAINAGFFIMGQGKPLGMIVKDGELFASPIIRDDMPGFALTSTKQPLMDFFQFDGQVSNARGDVFPLFGVNKLLYNLENGRLSDYDHLTLYNRHWGTYSRGGVAESEFTDVVETVVENNIVTKQVVDGEPVLIPANGYVLWGHGLAAEFMLEYLPVGTRVTAKYQTTPAFDKLKLSTGGNSFLVQGGAVAPFQEEIKGKNSRTAVATSNNDKTLYFIAVEKSTHSRGLEQTELAELLVDMKVETALNLDGGGSTTMVAKRLGDDALSNIVQPESGWHRSVTDSLAIFNTAPRGTAAGILINGPDFVLAGTDNSVYAAKGYDTHFYPWRLSNVNWSVQGDASITNGVLTANKGGDVIIEAASGTITGTKTVHVIGTDEIKELQVSPAIIKLEEDSQPVTLTFKIITHSGQEWPLETRYLDIYSTTGTISDGIFTPDPELNTGTIVVQYQDLTVQVPVRISNSFEDVQDNWAAEEINELASAGIIQGYEDGTYRPSEPVTRVQMVALLSRLMQWPSVEGELQFIDDIPDWAREDVLSAVTFGVVNGYPDQTFLPNRPVTRAEVAVILERAIAIGGVSIQLDFEDVNDIPDWAAVAMAKLVAVEIMQGYEDGTIRPRSDLTRAEIAALIARLMESNYVKVE